MNNPHTSRGILAPFVHDFIVMRNNLGFKSYSARYSLFSFNAFASSKGLSTVTVTRELAEQWCARRPHEATDTWCHRNGFLRQFCVYLSNLGYEAYVPPRVFAKPDTFIPYIFTGDELEALYRACDRLVLYDKHAKSGMMVLPALIRMLAATGIRIGEATSLLQKDVDLQHNYLIVRNCKNGKDRMVPFSESLADVCRQYRKYRELLPANSNFFFVKMNGCRCPSGSFSLWWNTILKRAGIKHRGNTVGPRMHDLRHTFCVKSMVRLAGQGKDLYYILPILSTYVGHQSLAATDRYVRMTAEMYPELLSRTDSICSYLFSDLKYS